MKAPACHGFADIETEQSKTPQDVICISLVY